MKRMMILIQGHHLHKLSWFTLASLFLLAAIISEANSKPSSSCSCQKERGNNLTAAYSFGSCLKLRLCSTSFSPPKSFSEKSNLDDEVGVGQLSPTQVRVNNSVSYGYNTIKTRSSILALLYYDGHIAAILDLNGTGTHQYHNTISETVNSIEYSFGFMGGSGSTKVPSECVKLCNINTLTNHRSSASIGCCNSSTSKSKGIKSLGAEPEADQNVGIAFFKASSRLLFFPMSGNISIVRSQSYDTLLPNKLEYYDGFPKTSQEYNYHRKNGRGYTYIPHIKAFPVKLTLGLGFCCLFLLFGITGVYSSVKKHKMVKLKSKFFQTNGGLLLEQHVASHGITKIFTAEELQMTTDNYKKSHIFGSGDKVAEGGQIERFINDVVTLTKVDHQNVVKLLGCCLETEAPMLVYELACNGTLSDYIHHTNGKSPLPWHILLKIASESAAGLAYMHSAAADSSKPMIIHGNVKSSNILLTDCFMAKVSGFKPSRLVPLNESQISTLVQRTLGYLDPEYLRTGQLTEKSDVYSFGVVLLEILTGEMPISFNRPENQRIITSHFVSSVEQNQNGLFQNVAPQLVNEGNREQVRAVAELAKNCLKLSSAERPIMEQVAGELNRLSNTYAT